MSGNKMLLCWKPCIATYCFNLRILFNHETSADGSLHFNNISFVNSRCVLPLLTPNDKVCVDATIRGVSTIRRSVSGEKQNASEKLSDVFSGNREIWSNKVKFKESSAFLGNVSQMFRTIYQIFGELLFTHSTAQTTFARAVTRIHHG